MSGGTDPFSFVKICLFFIRVKLKKLQLSKTTIRKKETDP